MWELLQIVDLQLNFENCGNYYKIQKNHRPMNFLHKTAVLQPSSKLKTYFFNVSSVEKEFFKSMSSYNFRIDS